MWLLPIAFMIHDFEEIIMMRPWAAKNSGEIQRRFPALAARMLPQMERLSTSSFALAVAEEFILLSAITYFAVEYELYSVWAGVLLVFFIHLVGHIIQFVLYRKYVPVILTGLIASLYCVFALYFLNLQNYLLWPDVAKWTVISAVVLIMNLVFVHSLARRFEKWLNAGFAKS
ncbi:MAG TPA: HXXEE domain-containing protein [Anaerolineales bacterium]